MHSGGAGRGRAITGVWKAPDVFSSFACKAPAAIASVGGAHAPGGAANVLLERAERKYDWGKLSERNGRRRAGPHLEDSGSADIVRDMKNLHEFGPCLANFGQCQPTFGECGPISINTLPKLVDIGPNLVKFGRMGAFFGKVGMHSDLSRHAD